MNELTKEIDDAITKVVEEYNHNLPDILEIIIQITMREIYKQSGYDLQPFRDMAHEIIDLT